jgi:hypothetical protein
MKTSELTGATLAWAVHVALYGSCEGHAEHDYSTDWSQGGPIIEREGITITQYDDYPNWSATLYATDYNEHKAATGPTPLIAAMRCYVASKLGAEIEIPKELL